LGAADRKVITQKKPLERGNSIREIVLGGRRKKGRWGKPAKNTGGKRGCTDLGWKKAGVLKNIMGGSKGS